MDTSFAAMDRPLAAVHLKKRRQGLLFKLAGGLVVLLAAGYWFSGLFSHSVDRRMVRLFTAELGPVEASFLASGTVVPAYEQSLISPIDSRIMKVLRRAGDSLQAGDPVLLLDTDFVRISIRKTYDQLALKSNALAQLRASFEGQLITQQGAAQNLALEVAQKQRLLEQHTILLESKAIAPNEYDLAKLAYEKLKNEYQASLATLENLQKATLLQAEGLQLEVNILKSELEILENQLAQADTRTSRPGILTWVLNTEGGSVQRGTVLAKVADLSAYYVQARVSEIHLAQVSVGMPAKVKVFRSGGQESLLTGQVSNISPSLENGVAHLEIRLDRPDHEALRPSQRVEVQLVAASVPEVVRVQRPNLLTQSGVAELFVVRGDGYAEKRRVEAGLSGPEFMEIRSGLAPGEHVIVSDMGAYAHLKKVKLE
jgi:HlyD family secretion protein